jgi:hypothetical protein
MGEQASEPDADAGREPRTPEDLCRYLEEISRKRPESSRATQFWHTAKQGMWLLLLVAAFLQYYFLDILVEINSLPEIRVSAPATVSQRSRGLWF